MVIITRIAAVTLLFTVSAALAGPANPNGKPEETSEYENKQPPLAPGIKFPNRFLTSWWFTVTRGGKPYINCNHTTKTCDRGAIDSRSECFVGAEVPDEDRNHVLRNIGWCNTRAGLFTDYVTGDVYQRRGDDRPVDHMKVDFEPMCVEWARDQNHRSPPVVMLNGTAINMCGLPDSSH
jgi:hypothetical protein